MSSGRYVRLFGVQARASLAQAMQYHTDFLISGATSLFYLVATVIPLLIVFKGTTSVAGWTQAQALLVFAWFTTLRGILEGAINPSLLQISDQIRTGTLDFVLVKPADAQFLVSASKFAPWKILDVFAGCGLAAYAFYRLGTSPTVPHVLLSLLLLVAALLVLYSIWILVVCASFWVVRLDNLAYLLSSIFDAARWPIDVFRGFWRTLFTFVLPLGLMTTYPAKALLGTLSGRTAVIALVGAVIFAGAARAIWVRAIGHYTSASS